MWSPSSLIPLVLLLGSYVHRVVGTTTAPHNGQSAVRFHGSKYWDPPSPPYGTTAPHRDPTMPPHTGILPAHCVVPELHGIPPAHCVVPELHIAYWDTTSPLCGTTTAPHTGILPVCSSSHVDSCHPYGDRKPDNVPKQVETENCKCNRIPIRVNQNISEQPGLCLTTHRVLLIVMPGSPRCSSYHQRHEAPSLTDVTAPASPRPSSSLNPKALIAGFIRKAKQTKGILDSESRPFRCVCDPLLCALPRQRLNQ